MHKIGIIILAHTALNRVEQSAKFWSRAGCPVVIHVDELPPMLNLPHWKLPCETIQMYCFAQDIAVHGVDGNWYRQL